GTGLGALALGPAPDRRGQRARLPGPKPLADVLVRGETTLEIHAAGASRGPVPIFSPGTVERFEASTDGSGTNLAVVLAASWRFFFGALSLPSGRQQWVDIGRKCRVSRIG